MVFHDFDPERCELDLLLSGFFCSKLTPPFCLVDVYYIIFYFVTQPYDHFLQYFQYLRQ